LKSRNSNASWTRTRFPLHTKKLALDQTSVVTVTGKAFFNVGHSLKDQKLNRRSHLPGYAAWEIHRIGLYRGSNGNRDSDVYSCAYAYGSKLV
jgi:hypothetical protein